MPTAFLRKPIKTVCVDTVLFFALFALVGHITINCWERYTIQSELHSMKHSLYILKDTVGNIGKAYDNLHKELKGLMLEVDRKGLDTPECRHKEKLEARCKAINNLDVKHRDFEIQTVLTTNKYKKAKVDVGVATEIQRYSRGHKATGPLGINASTNTKNPKSIGTTLSGLPNEKDNYIRHYNDNHCRHICHGVD